jgi:hypothetical protein
MPQFLRAYWGVTMEGRWVNDCQRILNEIKNSKKNEGQDRLDIVRTIRFTILALQRSVTGWMQWADNPDVMAQFSLEELMEINGNLADLVCAFVDYDAQITGNQEKKIEKKIRRETIKKPQETKDMFYVK